MRTLQPLEVSPGDEPGLAVVQPLEFYSEDQARDDHGRWTGGGDGSSDVATRIPHSARDAADQLHAEASRQDGVITPLLKQVVDVEVDHGAGLAGLEHALKGADEEGMARLEEKIQQKIEAGKTIDQARDGIGDSLRYTVTAPAERQKEIVQETMDTLTRHGYTFTEVENYWPKGDAYNGINATFRSPNGLNVELQFHTPSSFFTKDSIIHDMFKSYRDSATPDGLRWSLFQQMRVISDRLPVPPDIMSVGTLTLRPFQPNNP